MKRTILMVVLVTCCMATTTWAGRARTQCEILERTLDMYEVSEKHRAASLDDLQRVASGIDGLREDPWGRPYLYEPDAIPRIRSAGKDGVPHTRDDITATTRVGMSCVP